MTEIALDYACGCRDVWQVSALGAEPPVVASSEPCVPDSCQTCQDQGRLCDMRESMLAADQPAQFVEITGPKRYTRMRFK